jgi:hypothetical protein
VRRKLRIAILAAGLVAASLAVVPAMAATPQAAPTAQQLLTRAHKGCSVVSNGKYKTDGEKSSPARVPICKAGSAFVWTADMDIDCDGIKTSHCNHDADPWYQPQTSFKTSKGKWFTSDKTHYFVIPLPSSRFNYKARGIKPGSVAAVIYKNKVVYAVFADEGPNNIIGEASWLTAHDLGINPDPENGGVDGLVVTYIVFPGVVPSPVENNSAITAKGTTAANAFIKS